MRSRERVSRRDVLAVASVTILSGCLGGPGSGGDGETDSPMGPDLDPDGVVVPGAFEPGEAAIDPESVPADIPVAEPVVPLSTDLSDYAAAAAPSAADTDAIPSLEDPDTTTVRGGDDLYDDDAVVFGVVLDGDARAYPQSVLVWHEIANDTLGGRDIAVTYCPLTGTAIGFRRGGITFGIEGWLVNSNLVLFDRATHSWWPQVLGTAVTGDMRGYALTEVQVVWTTWGRWKRAFPSTTVLTQNTGYARDYGTDPYGTYVPTSGYYASDVIPFPVMTRDDRLAPKDVVLGTRTRDGVLAFEKDRVREEGHLTAQLAGVPYLCVYEPVLDSGFVYRNPDGQAIESGEEGVRVDGEGYAPGGLPLEPVNSFDAMWFAWAAYYPETALSR